MLVNNGIAEYKLSANRILGFDKLSRTKNHGITTTNANLQNTIELSGIAGENLTAGVAVNLQSNGLWYKARNLLSLNKKAYGICKNTVLTGYGFSIVTFGKLSISSYSFTTDGANLWHRFGTLNISETALNTADANENFNQYIGHVIHQTTIFVDINKYIYKI